MKSILDYIAKETNGKNYKSYKYCFENVEVPKLEYDDKQGIKVKRSGETDKSLKTSKSIKTLVKKVQGNTLFKYFLDGSRRTIQSSMILLILSTIWTFKTKNNNKEINGIFCLY
ncbi:MAG: hypothetical protein HN704_03345 [Bacteroidetes bacterium]|mgnify:FL=1|jgi:hypothetical protein|nr:hypothetical protein [Bacteroidota bacterium]MBT6686563.1 hypothetical protein [Bacteroidota bacterium]MBT7142926.1 hypothetical protein [Bacteroidota bacterium]MBT7490625.1 hypothetical protein [Bacteroidota bacterium]